MASQTVTVPATQNYYHSLLPPGTKGIPPPPPVPLKRSPTTSQRTGPVDGSAQQRHQAPRPPPVAPRRGYTYEPFPGNTMSLPPKRSPQAQSHDSIPTPPQLPSNIPSVPVSPPQLPQRTYSFCDTPAVPTSPRPNSEQRRDSKPTPPQLPQRTSSIPTSPRPNSAAAPTTSPRYMIINESIERQVSDGLSLAQLAEKYSSSFPVQMKVLKGYCGQTSRLTISTQDTYNIHFVKHTKVVAIKDAHDTPYSIPLNSAVEFGIVYDPNNSRSEASNGLTFRKISDIIALPSMPRVICAKKAVCGDDERTSVYANEGLVVKGIHKSKFKGKKSLKLYSILTKKDKLLPEDLVGSFTTEPYHCRMYLPELIEQIQDPFPGKAILFLSSDVYLKPEAAAQVQDLPPALFSRIVRMEGCITESSLVASSTTRGQYKPGHSLYDPERDMLFDIPIHEETLKDIEVAVVEPIDTDDTEKLYDDTRNIFERFDPSKVITCKDASSENAYTAQNLFYNVVRPGCETVGVKLDTPSAIYDNPRLLMKKVRAEQEKAAQAKSEAKSSQTIPSQPPQRQPQPPVTSTNYDEITRDETDDTSHYYEDQGESDKLQLAIQTLEKRVNSLQMQNKKWGEVSREVDKLKSTFEPVARQVKALDIKVQQLSSTVAAWKQRSPMATASTQLLNGDGSHGDASFVQANKAFLESMDALQIQNLLEAMGLTQHKDTFSVEQVTGEILIELEENDLQNELGMTSKIHRVRLMKIIRGYHSAENILAGLDPYVSFGSH